jgi:8-oxo-dGTP pyrophosphatase MutT (NUDIX family)
MSTQSQKYVGAGVILVALSQGRRYGQGEPHDSGETQEQIQEPLVLLLLGRTSGVWSFSKGHPEEVDRGSPLRTAVRETQEETGYIAGLHYNIMGDSLRFGKRPYWVGIMKDNVAPVKLATAEHSAAGWFTATEAAALNTNTDVRAWIKKSMGDFNGWTRLMGVISSMQSRQPTRSSSPGYSAS